MSMSDPLSELPKNSIRLSSTKRMVHLDGKEPEIERNYLTLSGTSDGLRWLARQLTRMANSVEKNESGLCVIIDPADFASEPVRLESWDALELDCRQQTVD